MSTRSNIALKLRHQDFKNRVTNLGEEFKGPYLQVYCHFDGYPEGVGLDLVKKNFTYDEALEFILKGDRSTCEDGKAYYEWRDESYDDVKPQELPAPEKHQEYLYLLQENGNTGKMDVYLYLGVLPNSKMVFERLDTNDAGELIHTNDKIYIYSLDGIY